MSVENSNQRDFSDYDSISLTESVDGSPTKKAKKKKKLNLFHYKSKRTEKKVDSIAVVNGNSDTDVQMLLHETQVTTTTTTASLSTQDLSIASSEDSRSLKSNASTPQNETNTFYDTANNNTLDVPASKKETSSSKKQFQTLPPTHLLKIRLLSGENLAPRDTNGLSDPYVKFKVDGKTAGKSKCCKMNLNPRWDQDFEIMVNQRSEVAAHVYDWDRGFRDDFMGMCTLDLSRVDVTGNDVTIELQDPACDEELGYLHLRLSLIPLGGDRDGQSGGSVETDSLPVVAKTTPHASPIRQHTLPRRRESDFSSIRRRAGSNTIRNQLPVATATIQLVSGSDLPARDANGLSDPYVKLQMAKQKRKSKVCYKTLNPTWKEEYTFHLYNRETSLLDVTVWDRDQYRRDDFIGRCELDLWSLDRDETHSMSLNLVDTSGSLLFLVTVHNSVTDQDNPTSFDLSELRQKYAISSSLRDLADVGFVEIRIVSASNLRSADINGKSDPFCVVQLCNARAQTQTCYKTLDPVWNRVCTFPVHDIHDVFELQLFDQDKDSEKEFLGRVSIPILRVRNGEQCSYVLKDRKLKDRTKGTVTVQINYIFNPVRAAVRTFSPREEKFMEEPVKFKKNLLLQNFQRVWRIVQSIIATAEFVNSCFTWENPRRSAFAFATFLLIAWNFELYMFPIVLLLLFLKNYIDIYVRCTRPPRHESVDDTRAEDDDQEEESGNKLSLMQKLNAIQDVLGKVQNILDAIASFGERIYNTFTWSVPFLSRLAVVVLCVVALVLYLIPLRAIVLIWGINKFTKRLRKPNYVPNNELMDFLSRIPSNVQLDEYRELKLNPESPRGSKKKK